MPIVSVAIAGPWWTLLSYYNETSLPKNVRVRVPLGVSGKSARVGLTCGGGESPDNIDLKSIAEVIDETPPLPAELTQTIGWFGRNWFLGYGMAMKTLLPSKFLKGEKLVSLSVDSERQQTAMRTTYIFQPSDRKRYFSYVEMLEGSGSDSLVMFPEVAQAKSFWDMLPEGLKAVGLLWLETGQKKQWELWQRVRLGDFCFIVGSPAASCLPMPKISRIIVDDELSAAWRTQKHPEFHRRSLLAARCRNAGAELVLGGRMPSSKVALQDAGDSHSKKGIEKRTVFVSLHDTESFEAADIKGKLPISLPLVRETRKALEAGRFAMWILDRKGYAGEIFCDECGLAVVCRRCGRAMRWEEKNRRIFCTYCSYVDCIPDVCPSCKSGFLAGQRPGIEAIAERAKILFRNRGEVVQFDDKMKAAELMEKHRSGALLIGTRKIIALSDILPVSLAGWIDADGEARSTEYDSRVRALGLIWESAWRGCCPEDRTVVVQSRRPGQDWQGALRSGWGSFWRRELKERKVLGLPPFMPMLKIITPRRKGPELARRLSSLDFDFWQSDESEDEVWVRTRHFEKLRSVLDVYFEINKTRVGMPALTLYLD